MRNQFRTGEKPLSFPLKINATLEAKKRLTQSSILSYINKRTDNADKKMKASVNQFGNKKAYLE